MGFHNPNYYKIHNLKNVRFVSPTRNVKLEKLHLELMKNGLYDFALES